MLKLVQDRIAVVPLENPEMTSSGRIIIPEMAKTRLNQGFIKYIGPDVQDHKVGDYVLYSGYSGSDVHIDGEGKLIILEESFLIAKISVLPNLIIPGLYFKDKEGETFPANYENAMDYIMLAFNDNKDWRNGFNINNMENRRQHEYDTNKGATI